MTGRRIPAAPEGLSEQAQDAWPDLIRATRRGLDPDRDPVVALEYLLRLEDRLRQVREVIDGAGVIVTGSMGQVRAHPLLNVERELMSDILAQRRSLDLA